MSDSFLSTNWSTLVAHVPSYTMLLVSAPPLSILAIKLWQIARASAGKSAPAEWVASGERDLEGNPLLARRNDIRLY